MIQHGACRGIIEPWQRRNCNCGAHFPRFFLTGRRHAHILVRIRTAWSTTWSHAMRRLPICLPLCARSALLLSVLVTGELNAQEQAERSITPSRTFRPVVRGTQYAL